MPHPIGQQRLLACHFSHLPTDRIARNRWGATWRTDCPNARPDEHPPIVVVDTVKNAVRIVAMEADDRLSGIRTGQSLGDARALYPDLDCVQRDVEADRHLLHHMARWCERYTPLVAFGGEDCLMLDITGCAHLFGGEESLLEDLRSRFEAQGLALRTAIAGTVGAAWAMARYGEEPIAAPGEERRLLDPLPLGALRLEADKVQELARLGFKTVGCLFDLPRAPIAARFGTQVLQRLDQALGREDEVLCYLQPVAELVSEKRFAEPIVLEDDLHGVIAHLAERLVPRLEQRGLGMRRCQLAAFRADGEMVGVEVEASTALRDSRRIASLFRERLAALHDEWEAGFGFDVLRLSVLRSDPLDACQQDLLSRPNSEAQTGHLVDHLSARLGTDRVAVYALADTHIPERRFALASAMHAVAAARPAAAHEHETATRPLVLFERPERVEVIASVPEGPPVRLRWRRAQYEIIRSEGPERIACEWWKDGRAAYSRDYFRVETRDGHRLWLFRHGLYERETNDPDWYVQGLFA